MKRKRTIFRLKARSVANWIQPQSTNSAPTEISRFYGPNSVQKYSLYWNSMWIPCLKKNKRIEFQFFFTPIQHNLHPIQVSKNLGQVRFVLLNKFKSSVCNSHWIPVYKKIEFYLVIQENCLSHSFFPSQWNNSDVLKALWAVDIRKL